MIDKGASMPAKLLIEKPEGLSGNAKIEINGNIVGIMTLSVSLFEHIGEMIAKQDPDLFITYASIITKDIISILRPDQVTRIVEKSGKEKSDAD